MEEIQAFSCLSGYSLGSGGVGSGRSAGGGGWFNLLGAVPLPLGTRLPHCAECRDVVQQLPDATTRELHSMGDCVISSSVLQQYVSDLSDFACRGL